MGRCVAQPADASKAVPTIKYRIIPFPPLRIAPEATVGKRVRTLNLGRCPGILKDRLIGVSGKERETERTRWDPEKRKAPQKCSAVPKLAKRWRSTRCSDGTGLRS